MANAEGPVRWLSLASPAVHELVAAARQRQGRDTRVASEGAARNRLDGSEEKRRRVGGQTRPPVGTEPARPPTSSAASSVRRKLFKPCNARHSSRDSASLTGSSHR